MRLVTAILARNEGAPDRYLARVLKNALSFSDQVLLLDDASTDNTREIALELGVSVSKRPTGVPAWGKESSARQELWTWAAKEAKDGWLLIQDADMILQGDPRPYCYSWDMNSWAWPLVDLWDSEDKCRIDGPWAFGPRTPRPWLFRPSRGGGNLNFGPPDAMGRKDWKPVFQDRGVHVGHCPANYQLMCGVAPDLLWLHFAYAKPEHRQAKLQQYLAVQDQLSPLELAHARSIGDPS